MRNILIVPMENTPGEPRLRGVPREVAAIINGRWWTSSKILENPNPSEVVQSLPSYNFVHFACHGQSHSIDPSLSRLVLLKKDSNPPEADSLSVKSLSKILSDDESKAVAFLSACNSAESESSGLHDESIHIAAGCQLAGFRHVIGTLWYAVDDACVAVTQEFYRSLFSRLDTSDVLLSFDEKTAIALHEAVDTLRTQEPDQPLMWAPFVHFGA
jgi:CHAT domain-containing protein